MIAERMPHAARSRTAIVRLALILAVAATVFVACDITQLVKVNYHKQPDSEDTKPYVWNLGVHVGGAWRYLVYDYGYRLAVAPALAGGATGASIEGASFTWFMVQLDNVAVGSSVHVRISWPDEATVVYVGDETVVAGPPVYVEPGLAAPMTYHAADGELRVTVIAPVTVNGVNVILDEAW